MPLTDRLTEHLIDRQFTAIFPGDAVFPAYSRAATGDFWPNWQSRAPKHVQLALRLSAVAMALYCVLIGLVYREKNTLEKRLSVALNSRLYVVRQAIVLLKIVASLAYFSDPRTQALGRQRPNPLVDPQP